MTKRIGIIIAAIAFAAGAAAQQDRKTDAQNVSGVWQMNVQADHVVPIGMELKQDGKKVTGTILMPTQHVGQRREVALEGEIVDRALKVSGTVDQAAEPTTIEINARVKDDGTLEGTLSLPKHNASFTAERLREPK